MPETFPDGFPMNPAEAIEFSYFFSEPEKQEWREWLQTATLEEKNELVDMLHKIWLDKQKNIVPDQFTNNQGFNQAIPNTQPDNQNSAFQAAQNPFATQPTFAPQPDLYAGSQPNSGFAPSNPQSNPNFNFDPNTNFGGGQNPNFQAQNQTQFNQNPATNPFAFDTNNNQFQFEGNDQSSGFQAQTTQNSISDGQGQPKANLDAGFSSSPILNDPKPDPADFGFGDDKNESKQQDEDDEDFDFSFDDSMFSQDKEESENDQNSDTTQKNDSSEDSLDQAEEMETEVENNEFVEAKEPEPAVNKKSAPSFSISKVREEATKEELDDLYKKYLDARSSISNSKQDHDQSYDDLMQKVISIVLNFESVSDYLEFMTDKLSEMNETIRRQAEEITSFKTGQNNYAHDLQNEFETIKSKVDLLEKRLENEFELYRARLDNLEIKTGGNTDSAYSNYDLLNTQIDLLKSKMIKLEKGMQSPLRTNLPQSNSPVQPTAIPHPSLEASKQSISLNPVLPHPNKPNNTEINPNQESENKE